jgi:hypothetical protein
MSKKSKKSNNIGTAMHTVSYLSQPYVKSDSKKRLTLQEIVENQEKHVMLIPRSEEDQSYIEELESSIVKDIPNEVLLQKCESYFTHSNFKMTESEISNAFERRYCVRKTVEKIDVKKAYDALFNSDESYVEPEIEPHTCEQKLNLLCHCHNCDSYFPLKNLKWIDIDRKPSPVLHSDVETLEDLHWNLVDGNFSENEQLDLKIIEIIKNAVSKPESDIFYPYSNLEFKYYGLVPKCTKYPICPSPFSCHDLWLRDEQYSLEDHKKGKYHQ